jgi:hypothetical protein
MNLIRFATTREPGNDRVRARAHDERRSSELDERERRIEQAEAQLQRDRNSLLERDDAQQQRQRDRQRRDAFPSRASILARQSDDVARAYQGSQSSDKTARLILKANRRRQAEPEQDESQLSPAAKPIVMADRLVRGEIDELDYD